MTVRHSPHARLDRHIQVAAVVLVALILSTLALMERNEAFQSSELAFSDQSSSGLAIVPASCASDPHYAGECDPPATCSVSFGANPIINGQSTTLYWSSTYAHNWVLINNVGYVSGSGSTTVAPSSTTDYSCYGSGYGGSDGWHSASLTVYQNCTFNGAAVGHGASVTGYQASTVPFGSSCSSETRTCSNGTLSGSYAYSSCSVAAPANCSLDSVTVTHNTSRTFYSSTAAPVGTLCSAIGLSRSCWNGTLSGSSSYQYASCTCAAIYYCSGASDQTITYRNTACSDTAVTTCTSPSFCVDGFDYCKYNAPTFNAGNGNGTGHLSVVPQIIRSGETAKVRWSVSDVWSCSVTENNSSISDTWSTLASANGGNTTSALSQQTTYTLTCDAYPEQTFTSETATVNIVPTFNEQ